MVDTYTSKTARRREQVRVNQRRYRKRHRLAIKVAENLEVPIARARVLLQEIRT